MPTVELGCDHAVTTNVQECSLGHFPLVCGFSCCTTSAQADESGARAVLLNVLNTVPGSEFAGVIRHVGPAVEGFAIGDRVFGGGGFGAYAEVMASPAAILKRLPSTMSFEEASSIYLTWPTSYAALVQRAKLCAGEICVVLGATGGVGACAGATVIAVVSSLDKARFVREIGAHHTVCLSDTPDWPTEVKRLTEGAGADVIYDPVGLPVEATKCIAWNGRLVVIGFAGGSIPSLALNRVLLKNMSVVGLQWGAYAYNEPDTVPAVWDALWALYREGKLKPLIHSTRYALEDVPKALQAIADRCIVGKAVIHMRDEPVVPPAKL